MIEGKERLMASVEPEIADLVGHFDFTNPDHVRRMWEFFDWARVHAPVMYTDAPPGYWLVCSYEYVHEIASDPGTFSSSEIIPGGAGGLRPPLDRDPPEHRDYRRILKPYFSARYLGQFEAPMRELAVSRIEKWLSARRCELLSDYAEPFSADALSLVVLDEHDEARLRRATEAIKRLGREPTNPDVHAAQEVIVREFFEDRKAAGHERDDPLFALTRGEVCGRPLSEEEQIGTVATLFGGGLDTTKGTIGNIMLRLIEFPELQRRIGARGWTRDLDEYLRLDSTLVAQGRVATRDVDFHGHPIRKGDPILIHLASADRDARYFDSPAELHFDRKGGGVHAAFGIGIHRCIGAPFARLQIQIALEELFGRIVNPRLQKGTVIEQEPGQVYAPAAVPIQFDVR
jgi:cytochrome P450